MRNLASLGGFIVFAAASVAQTPTKSDFATDTSRYVGQPITVSVLPAPDVTPLPRTPLQVPMGFSGDQLMRMKECELVQIYRNGIPRIPPCGYFPGTVIFKPGTAITAPTSQFMKAVAWQGKYIPGNGTMVNKMFGMPSIKAAIGSGESWLDGGPSAIFDYQNTSFVWSQYRDELREVSPGVWLGIMHDRCGRNGPKIATWFALDAVTGQSGCKECRKDQVSPR
jgi:hypothetical protein